jgi:hypothetical protein
MSKDTFEGYKNKLVGRLYGLLCEKEKNGEWENISTEQDSKLYVRQNDE